MCELLIWIHDREDAYHPGLDPDVSLHELELFPHMKVLDHDELRRQAQVSKNNDLVKYIRGDVISAFPDGHDWTQKERKHPHWLILKVPGMSIAEGEALTSREPETPTRKLFHTRLFNLHLDHSDAHAEIKAIAQRTLNGIVTEVERVEADHIRAIRRRKLSVQDPDVIGNSGPSNVIG